MPQTPLARPDAGSPADTSTVPDGGGWAQNVNSGGGVAVETGLAKVWKDAYERATEELRVLREEMRVQRQEAWEETLAADREAYERGQQRQVESGQICFEYPARFQNPPGVAGEGYIYVVEFTTGTVKVGQTEDPRQRLTTHQIEAGVFGVGVAAYWISPAHRNFKVNETLLIAECRKVSRRSRREYYHELGYDAAVDFALGLEFDSQITSRSQVCVEMDRR
jgi:hypothetical protein